MSNDQKNSAVSLKRGAIMAACAVACVVVLTWASGTQAVKTGLADLKIIPAPEHYTELYFNDIPKLPTTGTGAPVTFSFTIHNDEGADVDYHYVVVFVRSTGVRQTIISSSANVRSGQTITIPETVTLAPTLTNSQMVVELPDLHQSIDWWIGKTQ